MMAPPLGSQVTDPDNYVGLAGSKVHERRNTEDSWKSELTTKDIINYENTYSVVGMPPLPVVMVRGSGSFLWDMEGKRYIDFNAGFSSVNQGHCHPRSVATMIKQCQILTLPSRVVYNEPYTMLCKKICEVRYYCEKMSRRVDRVTAYWVR